MWDLSSPTRDQTHIPCIVRWILNHCTTREVPILATLETAQQWKKKRKKERKENPSAMQEMQVRSLGREDPVQKESAIDSSILAWEILWTEEPGRIQSIGSQKSWTRLSDFYFHYCNCMYRKGIKNDVQKISEMRQRQRRSLGVQVSFVRKGLLRTDWSFWDSLLTLSFLEERCSRCS